MRFINFFISGMLAAMGAMACELVLSTLISIIFAIDIESTYSAGITIFLFIAVFIEESFKFLFLLKLFSSAGKKSFPLLSGMLFGTGFAIIEIYSKSISVSHADFVLSDFSGIFLIHLFTAGMIGYFVVENKFSTFFSVLPTLSVPILLHLAYNLLIIYDVNTPFVYAYLFLILIAIPILGRYLQNKNKSTIINSR